MTSNGFSPSQLLSQLLRKIEVELINKLNVVDTKSKCYLTEALTNILRVISNKHPSHNYRLESRFSVLSPSLPNKEPAGALRE